MKNKDLEFLKKHYGEQFSHLCRELFPTLLEQEGLLSEIISNKFAPTFSLAKDLKGQEENFKAYIYSLVDVEKGEKAPIVNKTPEELLSEAGYILYPECKTEEDIQRFKKYYAPGEELCTFKGGRLKDCRVWFAVKKNVDEIKRENFKNPNRQDEYGTSVISIQFTKSENSTVSIKNRYNHSVNNPDCTFGNNLDNIIEGLTEAFVNTYEISLKEATKQKYQLKKYVMAEDGKFYRYNFEKDNIYFCENNIIINNGKVERFNKDNNLVIDNFLVDLKNKSIKNLLNYNDSFIDTIGNIKSINVSKYKNSNKKISIETDNNDVKLTINSHNEIIAYINSNYFKINDNFMRCNKSLKILDLRNAKTIGNDFLYNNDALIYADLRNATIIKDNFLCKNKAITTIDLRSAMVIGKNFLFINNTVKSIDLNKASVVGDNFLCNNKCLNFINLQSATAIGNRFLYSNASINSIELNNVTTIGKDFLKKNEILQYFYAPKLKSTKKPFKFENMINKSRLKHIFHKKEK
ncbi:MAG: hypothetical protein ACI4R8_01645 [Candidatus Caccovivens sp.]